MQKTLKRLFMLLLSVALISCIAVFAACNKDEETNDGTVTITVKYPDGTPVNGHTDGTKGAEENEVWVQFCSGLIGCSDPVVLGEDGTLKLNIQDDIISDLQNFDDFNVGDEIEIHILGLDGYKTDGYGTFTTQDTFPPKLDITLVANS